MALFKKASKSQAKLRAAIYGPSGAGKTWSSLAIATGLGGPIAVLDTERGSASKYADKFEFDVAELGDKKISTYVNVLKEAAGTYNVVVIDSLSHAWQELLVEIENLARAKYRGNTWSAWSEGTPKQRQLIDAILDFPGHVICTMRSKTTWETEKDQNGRNRPIKIGLSPEQGKGIEYEFDMLLSISPDHTAIVEKDRSGKFQDEVISQPGVEFGKQVASWLTDDSLPKQVAPIQESVEQETVTIEETNSETADPSAEFVTYAYEIGLSEQSIDALLEKISENYTGGIKTLKTKTKKWVEEFNRQNAPGK